MNSNVVRLLLLAVIFASACQPVPTLEPVIIAPASGQVIAIPDDTIVSTDTTMKDNVRNFLKKKEGQVRQYANQEASDCKLDKDFYWDLFKLLLNSDNPMRSTCPRDAVLRVAAKVLALLETEEVVRVLGKRVAEMDPAMREQVIRVIVPLN